METKSSMQFWLCQHRAKVTTIMVGITILVSIRRGSEIFLISQLKGEKPTLWEVVAFLRIGYLTQFFRDQSETEKDKLCCVKLKNDASEGKEERMQVRATFALIISIWRCRQSNTMVKP